MFTNEEKKLFEYTVGYSVQKGNDIISAIAEGLIKVSVLRKRSDNKEGWICGTYIRRVEDRLKRQIERKLSKEELELIRRTCSNEIIDLSQQRCERVMDDEIIERLIGMIPSIRLNGGKSLMEYLEEN